MTWGLSVGLPLVCLAASLLPGTARARLTSPYSHTSFGALYTAADPIAQLSEANFPGTIFGSTNAWIVEFYATWCGGCQRFAPAYKAIANDVRDWGVVFKVAAVACSDPNNAELCKTYNVRQYPEMKFFPPFGRDGFKGSAYQGSKTAAGVRASSINYLRSLVSQGNQPLSWPRLTPYRSLEDLETAYVHSTTSEVDTQGRPRKLYVIVLEDGNSNTGLEVILDLSKFYPRITVATISAAHANKMHLSDTLPALYRRGSTNPLQTILLTAGTRRTLKDAILRDNNEATEIAGLSTTQPPPTTPFDQSQYSPSDGLHLQDLESNLYYSLWVEVATHPGISGEALAALQSYFDILDRYLPGDPHIKQFLHKASAWLRNQTDDTLSSMNWTDELTKLQTADAYVLNRITWTGCSGTQPRFRGYPCSLWMAFHALTVSAHHKERHNADFDPQEVLESFAGYIKNFFSCRECAGHFGAMASTIRDVHTRRDMVLWLWKAHNKANYRLHNDPTEDPRYPKVQFPSRQSCRRCSSPRDLFDYETEWNEDEVLRYLKKFYGQAHLIDDDLDAAYKPGQDPNLRSPDGDECVPDRTPWSACSKTCGMGLATRLTNSNIRCRLEPEAMFCELRPCGGHFSPLSALFIAGGSLLNAQHTSRQRAPPIGTPNN